MSESSAPSPESVPLIEILRTVQPFEGSVVQSPWLPVTDAGLYLPAKRHFTHLVQTCSQVGNHSRCATVIAPPGYGKTHLLAWLRAQLEAERLGLFVYVPPVQADGLGLDRHLVRSAFDSLFYHSEYQRREIIQAIRSWLLGYYDEVISNRSLPLRDLGIAQTWLGLFYRRSYYARQQSPDDQEKTLRRALGKRQFLEHAFQRLHRENPPASNATRTDREAFISACYLACGDDDQQVAATRWFQGERIPVDQAEALRLAWPCEGEEKTRNALFTLRALAGQSLCFAYDQLEDSYRSFTENGRWEELRNRLGWAVNNLSVLPGISQIFAFEQIIWEGSFRRQAPSFLIDRMIADGGELRLLPLKDDEARQLVQTRMAVAFWSKHPDRSPPEPIYPFTADEIARLRREGDGEPRDFLSRARALYLGKLFPTPQVLAITPTSGAVDVPNRVVIRGVHFPGEVRVLFDERTAVSVNRTPDACEIHATTPTGLQGRCRVVVLDATTSEPIQGELTYEFRASPPIPRPLHLHIDRVRMKQLRNELGLRQIDVGDAVGSTQALISRFERGQWDPDDDLIERVAKLYGVSIEQLLREETE